MWHHGTPSASYLKPTYSTETRVGQVSKRSFQTFFPALKFQGPGTWTSDRLLNIPVDSDLPRLVDSLGPWITSLGPLNPGTTSGGRIYMLVFKGARLVFKGAKLVRPGVKAGEDWGQGWRSRGQGWYL